MRAERRGRAVRGCVRSINQKFSGRSRVDELKSPGKPFEISKRAVWEAWEKVRANKGAPGVDGESIADFEDQVKMRNVRICDFWVAISSHLMRRSGPRSEGRWLPSASTYRRSKCLRRYDT